MKTENIIEDLLKNFPSLRPTYEAEKEFIEGMPHYVFESIFLKYIVSTCSNKGKKEIEIISDFLEEMATCNDEEIKNLLGVSIIEPLLIEKSTLNIIRPFLKQNALKELAIMENWIPEKSMTHEELMNAFKKIKK